MLYFFHFNYFICGQKIFEYKPYLSFSVDSFVNERFLFWSRKTNNKGRLSDSGSGIISLKDILYYSLWKLLICWWYSDIRDTFRISKTIIPIL